MAVTPIEIFSTDPGHLTDFSGFKIADIFNQIAVQRANSLQKQWAPDLDNGDDGLGEQAQPQQSFSRRPAVQAREILDDGGNDFMIPDATPPPTGPAAAAPEDYSRPAAGGTRYDDPADFIFNSEARRDKAGKLAVYVPPEGDGGGDFEIAGITAAYQPKEAAQLRSLIQSGRQDEAEAMAKDFYRRRAAPFTSQTANQGLRLQFADAVHHRGEGGLRRILQRATGSQSKDYGELISTLDKNPKALDQFHQARQDYEWEEVDRGRASRKKFRKGLQNRFDRAYQASLQY